MILSVRHGYYSVFRGWEGTDMRQVVTRTDARSEFLTPEGCYILEISNSPDDAAVSIAQHVWRSA